MANPFRDMSVIMQVLVALAITVVLIVVGVYVPVSPIAQERDQVDKAVRQRSDLKQEVTQLQVYRQRKSELSSQMDALNKQLDTLKTIVPEEKDLDEFIRMIQGAAVSSNVQIRRLTAQNVASKQYYFEMPFEVQADGPYFNILDFFGRLGRLSRIINVGDLAFVDPSGNKGNKYTMTPGTTVSAVFTVTTFFTKPTDSVGAPAAGSPAAGAPAKPPAKM